MSPSPTCASNLCSYSRTRHSPGLQGRQTARADTTLTLARPALDALALRQTILPEAVKAGLARVEGDAAKPEALFAMLDTFDVMFEVVEPKKAAK